MTGELRITAQWDPYHGGKWTVAETKPANGPIPVEGQDVGEFENRLLHYFPPTVSLTVRYDHGADVDLGPGMAPV